MTQEEKAVKNLENKGIVATEENGAVYVYIEDIMLEISEFEIQFQANEFDQNKEE